MKFNGMKNPIHQLSSWYFSKGALPYWCILALDCALVMFAGYLSFYFQGGGNFFASNFWPMTRGCLLCLLVYVLFFRVFHTYSGIMRYTSFHEMLRVFFATTSGSAVIFVYVVLARNLHIDHFLMLNIKYGLLAYALGTLFLMLVRMVVRSAYDGYRTASKKRKVFIYGVKEGGIGLARSLSESPTRTYRLAGFVNPDSVFDAEWLMGVKVFHDDERVVKEMQERGATVMIVSPLQSEHFTQRTELVDALTEAGIKILMMPVAEEWDGKTTLSHSQLKEVEIEDLLPRQKIEVDMNAIGTMLKGKRILITGAAGSIGSEMARQVAKFHPAELILVDQAETPMHDVRLYMANFLKEQSSSSSSLPLVKTVVGSITNQGHMEQLFAEHKPEYVFHAAAYKHVPMMEDNPAMAVQNNIYGTRVIADLAVKYGTKKFVMISTDKAVNPTNVMGCSKRICEIYCQSLNNFLHPKEGAAANVNDRELSVNLSVNPSAEEKENIHENSRDICGNLREEIKERFSNSLILDEKDRCQFVTTRFGNVLGSNGSVIPIFREQIKNGGPVKVTHPDIIRYFMLIPEACRLVLQAGTMGHGGEIFVFDMGEPVKIVDLAKRMIKLSGAKDVEIVFTGLRDGEKLYEELLSTKENTKPTTHPKIMVAQVREYPYDLALHNEKELYDLSFTFDDMKIVKRMKEIVPEYKSQCSKYEVLDK